MTPPLRLDYIQQLALRALVFGIAMIVAWHFLLIELLYLMLKPWVDLLVATFLYDKVYRLGVGDGVWLVYTSLMSVDDPMRPLVFSLKPTRFTVAIPLFWALALATPQQPWIDRVTRIIVGTLILWALVAVFICMFMHFKLALIINQVQLITDPPPTGYVLHLPYSWTAYYLSTVGRQLSFLVGPMFGPLVVWVLLNTDVVQRMVRSGDGRAAG